MPDTSYQTTYWTVVLNMIPSNRTHLLTGWCTDAHASRNFKFLKVFFHL